MASAQATDQAPQPYEADSYWGNRDWKTSARLHLQHWLFQSTLGFTLHPTIAASVATSMPLRVADLACGNGELARAPPAADAGPTLDGYDLNPRLFPAGGFLPAGVTLHAHDVRDAPPAGALGAYDVVHVRAFASLVTHNDVAPVLGVARQLLKPGGWVQWEEADQLSYRAVDPDPAGKGTPMATALLGILRQGGDARGMRLEWLHDLPALFAKEGFEATADSFYDARPEQYKAWTENYLTVWEELPSMLPSKEQAPNAPMSREMLEGILQGVIGETQKGVAVTTTKIVVGIGQKPA